MLNTLEKLLKQSASDDQFCTSFTIPAENFSIKIKGLDKVSFPISESVARALIKEANLASFGWRQQTVIDTRVRNVWEIEKEAIEISQNDFDRVIGPVLDQIKHDLGFDKHGELNAELHNLLIYEAGQFFSSHQDSEKNDGMVATMVVILPSAFKGGSLIIDQHGDQKSFPAPKNNNSSLNIVAFYADCHHEVKKVTSGYRIALTYNLFYKNSAQLPSQKNNPALSKAINDYFTSIKLNESLASYSSHPRWLVYLLDHQYSQKSLNWSQLKGVDRIRASQLLAAADELDLVAHLALADLRETWQAEEEYDFDWRYDSNDDEFNADSLNLIDLVDQEYQLAHWIDRKGNQTPLKAHTVPYQMFCWTKANDQMDPFRSEYEGYMGNYGNTLDRWYHRAAIVLWPKDLDYPSRFAIDSKSTLNAINTVTSKGGSVSGQRILQQIFPQWRLLEAEALEDANVLLDLALSINDQEFAYKILSPLNLNIVTEKICSHLMQLCHSYGEDWTVKLLQKWSEFRFCGPIYLEGLHLLVQELLDFPRLIKWMLDYQHSLLTSADYDNEQTASQVDLDHNLKRHMQYLVELMKAAKQAGDIAFCEQFVQHVFDCKRVYSSITLAKLALALKSEFAKEPLLKKIVAEAEIRLQAELSYKREDGDLSIIMGMICDCSDCKELFYFLKSKTREKYVWPLAKPRRQHIHQIIDGMGIGVTHVTQRTGSPHKLVLTKTKEHFKKEAAKRQKLERYLNEISEMF